MLSRSVARKVSGGLRRDFSISVCMLAGYPSMDIHGARIMEALKKRSDKNIEFFGLGGPKMVQAGLTDNLADINKLPDKPLYIFKNAHPWHRERLYAIYMIATRYRNWRVIKSMEQKLYDKLFEKQTSAILTLGNEYFMKRLYLGVEKQYTNNAHKHQIKPAMLYYDKLMYGQHVDHLYYLDHYFYTTPYRPANWQRYTFPSTYVGIQGVYDAYEYLYRQTDKFRGLVDSKGIYLNEEYLGIMIEELVLESRNKWRSKNQIDEATTLFFASPGSDQYEIKWSMPIISKAVDQFLTKFSKVSAENFAVVVSLPKGTI
jgi:lipid A disaccharide synthetase